MYRISLEKGVLSKFKNSLFFAVQLKWNIGGYQNTKQYMNTHLYLSKDCIIQLYLVACIFAWNLCVTRIRFY